MNGKSYSVLFNEKPSVNKEIYVITARTLLANEPSNDAKTASVLRVILEVALLLCRDLATSCTFYSTRPCLLFIIGLVFPNYIFRKDFGDKTLVI